MGIFYTQVSGQHHEVDEIIDGAVAAASFQLVANEGSVRSHVLWLPKNNSQNRIIDSQNSERDIKFGASDDLNSGESDDNFDHGLNDSESAQEGQSNDGAIGQNVSSISDELNLHVSDFFVLF